MTDDTKRPDALKLAFDPNTNKLVPAPDDTKRPEPVAWPKRVYMSSGHDFVGRTFWYIHTSAEPGSIPVVVYPAAAAPEPVAWRYRYAPLSTWKFASEPCPDDYRSIIEEEPLYLDPPDASAIRREEREQCVKPLRELGEELRRRAETDTSPGYKKWDAARLLLADAIRAMGEE